MSAPLPATRHIPMRAPLGTPLSVRPSRCAPTRSRPLSVRPSLASPLSRATDTPAGERQPGVGPHPGNDTAKNTMNRGHGTVYNIEGGEIICKWKNDGKRGEKREEKTEVSIISWSYEKEKNLEKIFRFFCPRKGRFPFFHIPSTTYDKNRCISELQNI